MNVIHLLPAPNLVERVLRDDICLGLFLLVPKPSFPNYLWKSPSSNLPNARTHIPHSPAPCMDFPSGPSQHAQSRLQEPFTPPLPNPNTHTHTHTHLNYKSNAWVYAPCKKCKRDTCRQSGGRGGGNGSSLSLSPLTWSSPGLSMRETAKNGFLPT